MTHMADATTLRTANPWWRSAERIADDAKIKACAASNIAYDPELRHQIRFDFEPDNTVVYTMRGPRQVGKTTLIKLQIQDFLKNGTNPWNIFYYSFDLVDTAQNAANIVGAYLDLSEEYRDEGERTYMFLDEITSVDNWQKAVKFLADTSQLKNCTLLATGSQANSILRAAERLPGRRGYVDGPHDLVLQPMSFSAFARMRNSDLAKFLEGKTDPGRKREMLADLAAKRIPEAVYGLNAGFADILHRCLNDYMLTGGTPSVVAERIGGNFVSDKTYKTYMDGIRVDWGLHNADTANRFGAVLANNMGLGVSWNGLLKQTDFGSWSTVQKYVYLLNDASIIRMLNLFGEENKQARFRKEKKIYFTDPFYYHIFNNLNTAKSWFLASERFLAEERNAGRIAECIAADHLARLLYDTASSRMLFDVGNRLFYWRNKKGLEVDFVLYDGGELELPVEIKYRNSIAYRELGGLASFLDATGTESGLVLSKDTLSTRHDYLVVPLAVFLALV